MNLRKQKASFPMSWARFIGLLQTDGNINFLIEKNGTFRPAITLTIILHFHR
jgi:hypothetical protein